MSTLLTSQPILADEVQTFKALITVHKVLQEGHPITVKEGQSHVSWLDSLSRGVAGEGMRGNFHLSSLVPGLRSDIGYLGVRGYWVYFSLRANLSILSGYGPLIREYVFFLESKLTFHRQHPEFNGELLLAILFCSQPRRLLI